MNCKKVFRKLLCCIAAAALFLFLLYAAVLPSLKKPLCSDHFGILTPHAARILGYHLVEETPFTEYEHLFVRPSELEDQLLWLKKKGYHFIFADEYAAYSSQKQVCLTFDDGYKDNLTELLPILEKYEAKATVFVAVQNLGLNAYCLTEEELKTLAASPLVHIGSHTMRHRLMTELSEEELHEECRLSKERLEEITGSEITCFAYPGGYNNALVRSVAAQYYRFAYGYACTNQHPATGTSPVLIPRIPVNRGTDGKALLRMLRLSRPDANAGDADKGTVE